MRSKAKKVGLLLLGLSALATFAELKLAMGVFVRPAHAVVGRPLTPVSYAGVARRTSRRTARRTVAYTTPGVW